MEAKNILHNLDEVFPEIAAHLQTMMATRYFLQLERNNIDKYLHTGALCEENCSLQLFCFKTT